MYNDISIGPITFHMYGIMVAIGFASAYLIADYRAKKRGLSSDIIFGILWCAMAGGLIGSRLLYYIVSIKDIIDDVSVIWDFTHGFVVYGGIIGGVLAGYIYCRVKKVKFFDYFDLVMPEVALAQGFGRIGCFFAGCCYGRETEWDRLKSIIDLMNMDMQTKEVFESVVRDRETYGIAYCEVIRSMEGEVVELQFIVDTPSIDMTYPLEPYVDTIYCYKGSQLSRKKKFRKFRQNVAGKTVYFKEFGDPRIMDKRD